MNTGVRIYLCSVPGELWDASGAHDGGTIFHSLVQDALGMERRLAKGVNQEVERGRYALCCAQIESMISRLPWEKVENGGQQDWKAGSVQVIELDEAYLDLQARLIAADREAAELIRLGSSFFAPNEMASHAASFRALVDRIRNDTGEPLIRAARERALFFDGALRLGSGVVEVQSAFHPAASSYHRESHAASVAVSARQETDDMTDDQLPGTATDASRAQIRLALRTGEGVNFSNQPHDVITEVLHEFVFDESRQHASVRVVYADGSEAAPLQLHCLRASDQRKFEGLESSALSVALISMRHLELDRYSDMVWLRNREASKSRTLAEADAYCYKQSREQFLLARDEGDLLIHLIQTGYQPAVVAFYRALVEELLARDGTPLLGVVPYYYSRRGRPRRLSPWY